jgi:hypothetical protein
VYVNRVEVLRHEEKYRRGRGVLEAAMSPHVNSERNSGRLRVRATTPLPPPTPRTYNREKLVCSFFQHYFILYLPISLFILSLISSFFILVCKDGEEFRTRSYESLQPLTRRASLKFIKNVVRVASEGAFLKG